VNILPLANTITLPPPARLSIYLRLFQVTLRLEGRSVSGDLLNDTLVPPFPGTGVPFVPLTPELRVFRPFATTAW